MRPATCAAGAVFALSRRRGRLPDHAARRRRRRGVLAGIGLLWLFPCATRLPTTMTGYWRQAGELFDVLVETETVCDTMKVDGGHLA